MDILETMVPPYSSAVDRPEPGAELLHVPVLSFSSVSWFSDKSIEQREEAK